MVGLGWHWCVWSEMNRLEKWMWASLHSLLAFVENFGAKPFRVGL